MTDIEDVAGDALERLEWMDSKKEQTPQTKARALTRRTALTAGAGAIAGLTMGQTVSAFGATKAHSAGTSIFGSQPAYKFTMVNHVTTNPFFTPTQYGVADAVLAAGLHVSVDRLGVEQRAADGFGVQHRDRGRRRRHRLRDDRSDGLHGPDDERAGQGHSRCSPTTRTSPTGASPTSARTCSSPGSRWARTSRRSSRPATVALFIATPGSANIQPRIDGAESVLKGTATKFTVDRDRRGRAAGADDDRGLLARSHQLQGHLRGRRRQHAELLPDDQEVRPEGQGRRAAATTSRRSPRSCSPPATASSRSTSSPTFRASCRSSSCSSTRPPVA